MAKCVWHQIENCPVPRLEEAVREFSHQHDEGVCRPQCYGCFIIREGKADADALLLQVSELKKALKVFMDASNLAKDITFAPAYKYAERVLEKMPDKRISGNSEGGK